MRKLTAVLALVAFVFCFIAPVSAMAEEDATPVPTTETGTINITNATIGNDYKAYKVLDLSLSADHEKYSYTISEDSPYYDVISNYPGLDLEEINNSSVYIVTANENCNAAELGARLKDAAADDTPAAFTPQGGAADTVVTFSGLELGYYMVDCGVDAVVSLDTPNTTVDMIDKNQGEPTIEKEITAVTATKNNQVVSCGTITTNPLVEKGKTSADACFGDTVEYTLTIEATNYVGEDQILSYDISDALPAGITFDQIVSVSVAGDNGSDVTLTEDEDYTVGGFGTTATGTINIPWVDENGSVYAANSTITVVYTATVQNSAVIAGDGNVNTATVTWNFENTSGSDTDTATVYTYAFLVYKVDGTGSPLADATFNLPFATTRATGGTNVYNYAGEGTTTVTTDATGQIFVKGVRAGDYIITETEAPDGYNKLIAPATVTVDPATAGTTYTAYLDENGEITTTETTNVISYSGDVVVNVLPIVNLTGIELPSTGGIGTTIFYAVGAALVLGAGVLLVTKRRMSAE